jgi:hypothetical protein
MEFRGFGLGKTNRRSVSKIQSFLLRFTTAEKGGSVAQLDARWSTEPKFRGLNPHA